MYEPWEMEELEKFDDFLAGKGVDMSKAKTAKRLRFLHGYKFDHEATLEALQSQLKWEEDFLPPKLTDKSEEILNAGVIYLHGRDKNFRPFIVFNAHRLISLDFETRYGFSQEQIGEQVLAATIFVMEWMRNHLWV